MHRASWAVAAILIAGCFGGDNASQDPAEATEPSPAPPASEPVLPLPEPLEGAIETPVTPTPPPIPAPEAEPPEPPADATPEEPPRPTTEGEPDAPPSGDGVEESPPPPAQEPPPDPPEEAPASPEDPPLIPTFVGPLWVPRDPLG